MGSSVHAPSMNLLSCAPSEGIFLCVLSQWLFPCALPQGFFPNHFRRSLFNALLRGNFFRSIFAGVFPYDPSYGFSPSSLSSDVFSVVLVFAGSPSVLYFTRPFSTRFFPFPGCFSSPSFAEAFSMRCF